MGVREVLPPNDVKLTAHKKDEEVTGLVCGSARRYADLQFFTEVLKCTQTNKEDSVQVVEATDKGTDMDMDMVTHMDIMDTNMDIMDMNMDMDMDMDLHMDTDTSTSISTSTDTSTSTVTRKGRTLTGTPAAPAAAILTR